MTLTEYAKAEITAMFTPEEVIEPSSPLYAQESRCWARQKHLRPSLIVRPRTIKSVQKIVPYLFDSDLDFAVRSGGCGSSSARDVVISMTAFDQFEFVPKEETVVIGAGQMWGDVDRKMEESAPGYAVLSARTPYVGVGGSLLSGCISWLSHEHGLAADPQNLLDAEIVLRDGQKIWASNEPDLLWALRGGGGNFGVVTAFRLRCYRCTSSIFTGSIVYPITALEDVSRGVSQFAARCDPKMALHVMIADLERFNFHGEPSKFPIILIPFDAHGEEHARSDDGFKWALDIPGAVATPVVTTIRELNHISAPPEHMKGEQNSYLAASIVKDIDPSFVTRGWAWYEKAMQTDERLSAGTIFLLEVMQKETFGSAGAPENTAWPHSCARHVLQLLTGFVPSSGCSAELALRTLQNGPADIAGSHDPADYFPNFIEPFSEVNKIFGANYHKLQQIKKRYDPNARLNKGCFIPPA